MQSVLTDLYKDYNPVRYSNRLQISFYSSRQNVDALPDDKNSISQKQQCPPRD